MIEILGREDGKRMLLESAVAVIGPVTGSTVELWGKRAEIVPETEHDSIAAGSDRKLLRQPSAKARGYLEARKQSHTQGEFCAETQ